MCNTVFFITFNKNSNKIAYCKDSQFFVRLEKWGWFEQTKVYFYFGINALATYSLLNHLWAVAKEPNLSIQNESRC